MKAGLLKILSKMGISLLTRYAEKLLFAAAIELVEISVLQGRGTFIEYALFVCSRSYHGAQIFEIYGLGSEVVDMAFRGSTSRIGGLNINEVRS